MGAWDPDAWRGGDAESRRPGEPSSAWANRGQATRGSRWRDGGSGQGRVVARRIWGPARGCSKLGHSNKCQTFRCDPIAFAIAFVRLAARFGLVPLTSAQDMNRDGLVNTTDVPLVRLNQTTTATRVSNLNLTGTSSGREAF